MKYELNQKLGKAGFPYWTGEEPTLSELIEACGKGFWELTKYPSRWGAYEWKGREGSGSTPEEAVANLWLALQSNK